LEAVDDLDRFCALWKRELRADLLRLHGMAHSLINDAPLTSVQGEEDMCEVAFSIAEEFHDWQQSLRSAIAGLDQLAGLAPDQLAFVQHHLHESAIDSIEFRRSTECIA
jgi:hypothetical protein